jgi:hypothetical protein
LGFENKKKRNDIKKYKYITKKIGILLIHNMIREENKFGTSLKSKFEFNLNLGIEKRR